MTNKAGKVTDWNAKGVQWLRHAGRPDAHGAGALHLPGGQRLGLDEPRHHLQLHLHKRRAGHRRHQDLRASGDPGCGACRLTQLGSKRTTTAALSSQMESPAGSRALCVLRPSSRGQASLHNAARDVPGLSRTLGTMLAFAALSPIRSYDSERERRSGRDQHPDGHVHGRQARPSRTSPLRTNNDRDLRTWLIELRARTSERITRGRARADRAWRRGRRRRP